MTEAGVSTTASVAKDGRRRSAAPRSLFGDIVQFADFVLIIAASMLVAYGYHIASAQVLSDYQYYAAAGIVGATGLTTLLRRDGFYEFDQLLSRSGSIRAIATRWVLVIMGLLAFGFALKISENFSRAWLFGWTFAAFIGVISARAVAVSMLRSMSRDGGAFSRRVAIVGEAALGARLAQQIGAADTGVSIAGFYGDNCGDEPGERLATSGDLAALELAARHGEIDDIVIAPPRVSSEQMDDLVQRLSALPVSVSICSNAHWLDHTGGAVVELGGANVLSLYRRPLEGWGGLVKTIEDYVLAIALIVVLSPLFLMIAACLRIHGGGPVLFAQQRHGFNHSVFRIYKFRTMRVLEDGEEIRQARPDDERITPLGRFLRRYSLDELPQLINVIKGEMSLVGPRPHALAHNHQYAQRIENYSGRHKVRPGITGWAQVNGLRGETSEKERMEERVRYDLAYIDNWSLWFDFKILVMTILAVAFPKNAV